MNLVNAKQNLENQLASFGLNPTDWQIRWPKEKFFLINKKEEILKDVVISNKEDSSFWFHAEAKVKNQGREWKADWLEIRVAGL